MRKVSEVAFANGTTACAVRVRTAGELFNALLKLGLDRPRPTLVLVGGAGGLQEAESSRLRSLFLVVLAPLAEALGAFVVDGGTDAGVMGLMGRARAEIGAAFPLIGVAATGTVALPGAPRPRPDAASLEPHHTHFVLVPGTDWGDEASWLARAASVLADGFPSATVLVNGGETALQDASLSVQAGRPVIVIAGSGRAADTLEGALRGGVDDGRARELAVSGLLRAVDMSAGAPGLAGFIEDVLRAKEE